jgi:hypothetical protein
MFIGAVPKEVVGQVLSTVPFDAWGDVYVGCSGSFRFDRAVKMRQLCSGTNGMAQHRDLQWRSCSRRAEYHRLATTIVLMQHLLNRRGTKVVIWTASSASGWRRSCSQPSEIRVMLLSVPAIPCE